MILQRPARVKMHAVGPWRPIDGIRRAIVVQYYIMNTAPRKMNAPGRRRDNLKKWVCFCLCAALCLLCACGGGSPSSGAREDGAGEAETAHVEETRNRGAFESGEMQFLPESEDQVVAVFETSRGQVRAILYPQEAPLAVENFCTLAEEGYYTGVPFERVLRDFVIQSGTGAGGDKSIWGHAFRSEYSDKLRHYAGALCMVAAPDGSGHMSRFYIVASPQGSVDEQMQAALQAAGEREGVVATYAAAGGAPYLDFTDTVFGQVVTGMDVVDEIARVPVDDNSVPKSPVTVDSVAIYGRGG